MAGLFVLLAKGSLAVGIGILGGGIGNHVNALRMKAGVPRHRIGRAGKRDKQDAGQEEDWGVVSSLWRD